MPSKKSSSKKQVKKSASNVFDQFTQKQVAEFKEGFQIMDRDRDGIIGTEDLRGTFDEIGRVATEQDLTDLLNDAPGPINFTTLLSMFAARSTGEADDDEVVVKAFRSFESTPGVIKPEQFRAMLQAFGDVFTDKECDEAFEQFDFYEDENIDSDALIAMLTASGPEEGEAPAEE